MATAEEAPTPKINNASLSDLKATSDDSIASYMNSIGYIQSHTLTDVHLALGYTAVVIAAACALYEYRVGFKEAKLISIFGVGTYFFLQAALYLWGYYVEKDIVYVGTKGAITVEISASVKKYDPTYNVAFRACRTPDSQNKVSIDTKKAFASWFDVEGNFVKKPFDNWLGENIVDVEKRLGSGKPKKKK